ncbi:PAS domain S-box [Marinitoga piezophila KA3]|uniref:PAS domain S-box n=1 Tax=Marinitoga piezophila (strain DSM 14283 / JCM 11233 / KA3) TaxID=443254 RepID=H2J327_MARPK|nr:MULTISPECIES: sigma-54-dependent Fis family transcriptional regulator [Marinitoga]AEX84545.1 PAS domain S-box [Marinitoga piezophila KA3]
MTNAEMIMSILEDIQEAVILINDKEEIIFLNNSAAKILSVPKEKVLHTKVTDSITDTRLHIVLKTGIPELDRIQNLGKKIIVTSRFPIRDENGEIIGAAAVFRDVTSIQKLAEEVTNLRELDSLLRAIIDSTYDAISVADEEGRIVMVNKAYTKVTGLSAKEVIGKLATYDIAEGQESMHIKCSREQKPILNVRTKLATNKKEVIINVNPIFVKGEFKGSVGVIHDISEIERLLRELEATKRLLKKEEARYTFEDIVSESEIMKNVVTQAKKAANTKVNVLLNGEPGVGKEILAQAIHNFSERRNYSFVATNLLLYDEKKQLEIFFGNENNFFEKAHKGTLFIDNTHLMGPDVQELFFEFLNTGKVIFNDKEIKSDVRIIFATPENLKELMSLGKFSRRLYYKISVVTIDVPPLRERKEDIPKMAKQILHILNQKHEKVVYGLSEDAVNILKSYDWPGNIRELENVLDRALMNMTQTETMITSMHLPELKNEDLEKKLDGTLKELLSEYEKYIIIETLKSCQGNKTAAAKKLGLTVRNLYYKLEKLGIK